MQPPMLYGSKTDNIAEIKMSRAQRVASVVRTRSVFKR